MFKLDENQVKTLREKVHSKEDLKKVLKDFDLNFTEDSLNQCYESLMNGNELLLDELDDVTGGYMPTGYATKKITKCWNCHKRIEVSTDPHRSTRCLNCGEKNTCDHCYDGC